jgi:C1A family cysteine protease
MRPACPEPYDQGNIGSSVAQAIAAGLEFSRRRQGLDVFTPSRLFIYYIAREADGREKVDAGATYRTALQAVNRYGFPPESAWPYNTAKLSQRPSRDAYRAAARHAAIAYKRVRGRLDHLKACLTEGYPVLLGFPVYNSIYRPEVAETGRVPVPPPGDPWIGGHAVMIVGYDDSEQVFIVQNSWGKNWGHDGFFYLPYAYISAHLKTEDFWTVRSVW